MTRLILALLTLATFLAHANVLVAGKIELYYGTDAVYDIEYNPLILEGNRDSYDTGTVPKLLGFKDTATNCIAQFETFILLRGEGVELDKNGMPPVLLDDGMKWIPWEQFLEEMDTNLFEHEYCGI